MKQSKLTHLMTSLVPGLGKRQLHFLATLEGKKITLRAGPELKFENYESVQHRLQFSGIKKGAKISFHRHLKKRWFSSKLAITMVKSLFSSFVIRSASGLIVFFITSGTRYKFWSSACWEAHLQSQHPSRPLLMRCKRKWSRVIGCIPIVSPPPTVLHPGSKVMMNWVALYRQKKRTENMI